MTTAIECRDMAVPVMERFQNMLDTLPAFSEVCWFMLSLILFMVLGPFAAPIAVVALFSIDSEHRGLAEPESAE